jgi:hypothetical protein
MSLGPSNKLAFRTRSIIGKVSASPGRSISSFVVAIVAIFAFGQLAALAWGNKGHEEINLVAAQKIPASMPAFLRTPAAQEHIAYLGPEPDRWRGADEHALNNAQAPDHFIDLERIEGLGDLPPDRYEFYKLLYAKRAATRDNPDQFLPENVGLQPYITMEVYERLVIAFRQYRNLQGAAAGESAHENAIEQDAIFYAAWLGHYAADGSQPLHTTINYDGWVEPNPQGFTTQKGLHWRFETDFVNRNISAGDFAGLVGAPQQLADPFHDYVKYLWTSHYYVPQLYEIDKTGGFNGAGTPEALKFTEQRMAAGAQMLLDLWYTAWLQSAQPEPEPAPHPAN